MLTCVNTITEEETTRHNKAEEESAKTKYTDLKNTIKEAVGDASGIISELKETSPLWKTIDEIEKKTASTAEKIAEILENPKGFVTDKLDKAKEKVSEKKHEIGEAIRDPEKKAIKEKAKKAWEWTKNAMPWNW